MDKYKKPSMNNNKRAVYDGDTTDDDLDANGNDTDNDLDDDIDNINLNYNKREHRLSTNLMQQIELNINEFGDDDNNNDIDGRLVNYLNIPLNEFMNSPVPKGITICTKILRKKKTIKPPSYHLYLNMYENKYGNDKLLSFAKKQSKSKSKTYIMYAPTSTILNNSSSNNYKDDIIKLAKLKSNLIGTIFTTFSNLKKELITIIYNLNPLGFKGPRKLNVLLPRDQENQNEQQHQIQESLYKRVVKKNFDNIIILENKEPEWNPETETYQLDFKQRVSHVSVKNFQLVHSSNARLVLLQSGKIDDNLFTLDFTYPFTPLQAFSIAISSLTNKLGCA